MWEGVKGGKAPKQLLGMCRTIGGRGSREASSQTAVRYV